ncbi:MAG: ATP-dependent sacrificial sulfur transferase LarE [Clostridiales bacterium]|nr:ATP-dependent sacrificial sulfur transferase LarE [Clostridiales bacterium]
MKAGMQEEEGEAAGSKQLGKNLEEKYHKLREVIRPGKSALVAFSGGADSALLAYAAKETLGYDNVLCVTARFASFPVRESLEAARFCEEYGIRHRAAEFDELGIEGFSENPPDRCYLCKSGLLSMFIRLAEEAGLDAVIEGSNADDEGDYRPGMQAVIELGVKSPLREVGLTKKDIRGVSKLLGLKTWDREPFACLASRFAYGEEITEGKLGMVDKAEQFLLDRSFESVRVRIHGQNHFTARIEAPPGGIERLAAEPLRSEAAAYFKSLGFTWVSLDLAGYRMGSMNEALGAADK